MARLIGLDVGTSSVKAVVIDETGKLLASASRAVPLESPKPGWTQQSPEDWWQAASSCLAELDAENADGIGLTGQMHGSVFLDADGQVIRPALLWNDQRTVEECREIEAAVGPERLREITGNPMLTGFQLPKLMWLKKNEPENFARVAQMLLPKDYIRFRMTGEAVTDVSDASGVGALDGRARDWSDEILSALSLDRSMLPEVRESTAPAGRFGRATLASGAGDQAAAAIGTGAVRPGLVSVSLGTSGVVYEAIDAFPAQHTDPIHDFADAAGGWHRMGVMLACGGSVEWARETLFRSEGFAEFDSEAGAVPWGCEGLTFAPYLAGERCPFIDPLARGSFAGLSLAHGRGHLARAALEGVSFGIKGCLELMRGANAPEVVRVTGGGAKSQLWLQILADALACPCETLQLDEGPALGAAILGGLSAGVWPDLTTAVKTCVQPANVTEPRERDVSEAWNRFQKLYPQLRAWQADA